MCLQIVRWSSGFVTKKDKVNTWKLSLRGHESMDLEQDSDINACKHRYVHK